MKKDVPRTRFSRSSGLLLVLGCAYGLIGCAPPRTPNDLLACANRNFASCRAAADRSAMNEAGELLSWACAQGDDETCLQQFVFARACAKTPTLDCPLVKEAVGESGVLANRLCDAGSRTACDYARELGHRSKLVLGTTLTEPGGPPLTFLNGDYLLAASTELTLFRLVRSGRGVRGLERVASRPLVARGPDNATPINARIPAFAMTEGGHGIAVLEAAYGKQYLWSLGSGKTPAPLGAGTRFSALSPRAGVLLAGTVTFDWRRYGVNASAIRLYDPDTLQLSNPGVELGVTGDRAVAAEGWLAVLGVGGVHLFDRSLSRRQLLQPRGVLASSTFTADERRILVTGSEGMDLYDLSNLSQPLQTRTGKFGEAAFSPDGARLAVETEYGLRILDAQTLADLGPELEPYYKPERSWIHSTHLRFDPTGSTLLVGQADKILVVSLAPANGRAVTASPAVGDPLSWFQQLEQVEVSTLYDGKLESAAVEGRVLLEEKPVTGAVIDLMPNLSQLDLPYPEWAAKARAFLASVGSRQATTDDAGRFRVTDLPVTLWDFEVRATGLIPKSPAKYPLLPGRQAFEIQMVRCATLEGHVQLRSGAAGAGFKVFLTNDELQRGVPVEVSADANGRYRIECTRPTNAVHLEAVGPNGEAAYRHLDLRTARAYTVDLSAEPFESTSLERLVVVSDDGTPLPDLVVESPTANDRTGPTGRWSSARRSGATPLVLYRGTFFTPTRRALTEPWRLQLPTAELLVRHPKLHWGQSITLGRATTTGMEYAEGTDDPLGTRFTRLSAGRWTMWRVDDAGRMGSASIELAAREVASVDAPPGTVSGAPVTGQVLDHDTGKPILGAQVWASCFNASNRGADSRPLDTRIVKTDPAGRFVVPCVSRDRHTFRVIKNGYVDQAVPIDARGSNTARVIDNVRLRRTQFDLIRALTPSK